MKLSDNPKIQNNLIIVNKKGDFINFVVFNYSKEKILEIIKSLIDFILHIDKHLGEIISTYGTWTYAILFLIIFCETGLVILPLLPGDSLLFAAGSFAAIGKLNPHLMFLLLSFAAILGDTVNYWIGNYIGPKAFSNNYKFLKKEHLEKTHKFYEKYGGKTIILARFVPIVRTFAPFVAGVGSMTYSKFLLYNVVGGVAWVAIFVYVGYFFGNLDFVQNNFGLVAIAIILLSLIPIIIEIIKAKMKKS
jgi:membrane-associated protein